MINIDVWLLGLMWPCGHVHSSLTTWASNYDQTAGTEPEL